MITFMKWTVWKRTHTILLLAQCRSVQLFSEGAKTIKIGLKIYIMYALQKHGLRWPKGNHVNHVDCWSTETRSNVFRLNTASSYSYWVFYILLEPVWRSNIDHFMYWNALYSNLTAQKKWNHYIISLSMGSNSILMCTAKCYVMLHFLFILYQSVCYVMRETKPNDGKKTQRTVK